MAVPVEDRLELGTERWMDAARAILDAGISSIPDDVRYSVSETFTDVPAHVSDTGTVAWHLEIDGPTGRVGAGPLEGADLTMHADWAAVLAPARTVYGGDVTAHERAQRELEHRNPGSVSMTGSLPGDPAVATLLGRVHDELAVRTIANFDNAHQLARLGLETNAAELDEQGYTIMQGAISEAFADELRAEIVRCVEETGSFFNSMLLERGRIFEDAVLHPWVMALAEHVCGKGMLLAQTAGIRRGSETPILGLHSDYNMMRDPFPERPVACTTIWALEDFTVEAGPTLVVPASHALKRHPKGEGDDRTVPILMPKGSIAMWDGATWHAQSPRTDSGERVTLHNTYSHITLRTYDDYRDIDPAILDRNPPELTTLCGHDDYFQKNTWAGPDFKRLNQTANLFRPERATRAATALQQGPIHDNGG